MSIESPPLKSRKFLAYLVAELTWKIILLVVLISGMKNGTIDIITGSIALAIVVIAGFIEVVYVGGQASADKYVQIAKIAVQGGHTVSMKGLDIKEKAKDAPKD